MWKYVQMQQRIRTSAYRLLAVIQRQFLSLLSVVKYLRNLFLQSADQMATESTHFQANLCHDDVDFRENDQHSHRNRVTT